MWNIAAVILGSIMFWNLLFAIMIIFFEHRDPKSVWAWLLLLFFLPGIGFVFYLLLGMDMKKRRMFRAREPGAYFGELIRQQRLQAESGRLGQDSEEIGEYADMIRYNLEADAVLYRENDIDFFTDGNEKFNALIRDLEAAESFIHIQYYIIRNDVVFQRILEVLKRKVSKGVRVRILYDGMGCRGVRGGFWKELERAGIKTAEFFPAFLGRLQLRINYRNHRKIVVIDNKIAYVGGFNIGKEYIGLDERFGYWRDTHLRITGSGVSGLQVRFAYDWKYAAGEELFWDKALFAEPLPGVRDACALQVISSGPDSPTEKIRDNYLCLIARAKKRIYIQTPYFIPDEPVLNALLIAVRSGVEVNLMIPCKPDHPFVYWATFSYMGQLVNAGANCYTYDNGFLHCKSITVDGEAFCCGTANVDIRSFALNFEVNVIVYNRKKAEEMEGFFKDDLKYCTQITRDVYAVRPMGIRFKEQVCRLLSPLL